MARTRLAAGGPSAFYPTDLPTQGLPHESDGWRRSGNDCWTHFYGMEDHTIPGDLPSRWRDRAETLRTYGDPNSARLWEIAAVELERAWGTFGEQTLSLAEAARVSGFTANHLGSLVKRGKITNAGRTGAPRIRRSDLPLKTPGGPGRPRRPRAVPTRETIRAIARTIPEEG